MFFKNYKGFVNVFKMEILYLGEVFMFSHKGTYSWGPGDALDQTLKNHTCMYDRDLKFRKYKLQINWSKNNSLPDQ